MHSFCTSPPVYTDERGVTVNNQPLTPDRSGQYTSSGEQGLISVKGQPVTFNASGGSTAPGFALSLTDPYPPSVDFLTIDLLGDVDIDRATGFTMTWMGGSSTVVIRLAAASGDVLECSYSQTGSAYLPPGALAYLPAGPATLSVECQDSVVVNDGGWPLNFVVSEAATTPDGDLAQWSATLK